MEHNLGDMVVVDTIDGKFNPKWTGKSGEIISVKRQTPYDYFIIRVDGTTIGVFENEIE